MLLRSRGRSNRSSVRPSARKPCDRQPRRNRCAIVNSGVRRWSVVELPRQRSFMHLDTVSRYERGRMPDLSAGDSSGGGSAQGRAIDSHEEVDLVHGRRSNLCLQRFGGTAWISIPYTAAEQKAIDKAAPSSGRRRRTRSPRSGTRDALRTTCGRRRVSSHGTIRSYPKTTCTRPCPSSTKRGPKKSKNTRFNIQGHERRAAAVDRVA